MSGPAGRELRLLGSGGLTSAPIALGCMGMSEFYGTADQTECVRTIHEAIERGVTLFDTADVYGPFTNEQLLGRAIAGRREDVTLMTKAGQLRKADDPAFRGLCGRPEHITRSCDESLRRLNTDWIDVYVLHRVDPATPVEETVGAMADLVTVGKVRYLGLSEVRPATLRRAHAIHDIALLQTEYSLWSRDVEPETLAELRTLGIGLVAYAPLGRGFLTGCLVPGELPTGDYRLSLPRFQKENYEHNARLVAVIAELAIEWSMSPAQLAISWLLHQGDDIVTLVGTTSRAHLRDNLGAIGHRMDQQRVDRLNSIFVPGAAHGDRYASRRTIDG